MTNKLTHKTCSNRYQKSADKDQYRYEEDFFEYLTYLHNDLERKIRRGKERKDKEVDETVSREEAMFFSSEVCPSF